MFVLQQSLIAYNTSDKTSPSPQRTISIHSTFAADTANEGQSEYGDTAWSEAKWSETNRNWQLTKTNYWIKMINMSQKFVKAVQWKHRISYNSSYANLNPTQPNPHKIWKSPPSPSQPPKPSPTHGWTRPTANSVIDPLKAKTVVTWKIKHLQNIWCFRVLLPRPR